MTEVADYRALISGYTWYQQDTVGRPAILTYSFDTAPPSYFASQYPGATSSFAPLNDSEKAVVRGALQQWSAVSGVQFIETSRHQGDITFAFYDLDLTGGVGAAGQGNYPSAFAYQSNGQVQAYAGDSLSGGDIWFDTNYRASSSFGKDFAHVALHEIGHALGLKHPFDTMSGHSETLTAAANTGANTVMSYDQSNRATTLGPLDIAAAQYLYGSTAAKGTEFTRWSYDPASEKFTAHGSGAADLLRGTGTDDVIYTEGGQDAVYTAQGNDVIVASGQALSINGGPGIDTVVTGLTLSNLAQIGSSGDARYMAASGGNQIYLGVERLVFTNDMIALDAQGNAGQAYRLYQAALNRTPDTGGLSWHVNRLDLGTSLHDDAVNFLAAPEFAQRFGAALDDRAFVTLLYANVLSRAPDSGGEAYWLGHLSDRSFDRATVLTGFSESPENHGRVDPTIAAGIHLDYGAFA